MERKKTEVWTIFPAKVTASLTSAKGMCVRALRISPISIHTALARLSDKTGAVGEENEEFSIGTIPYGDEILSHNQLNRLHSRWPGQVQSTP